MAHSFLKYITYIFITFLLISALFQAFAFALNSYLYFALHLPAEYQEMIPDFNTFGICLMIVDGFLLILWLNTIINNLNLWYEEKLNRPIPLNALMLFIPIVNIVMSAVFLLEIWEYSLKEVKSRISAMPVYIWWGTFWLGIFFFTQSAHMIASLNNLPTLLWMAAAGHMFIAISFLFSAYIVQRISKAHQEKSQHFVFQEKKLLKLSMPFSIKISLAISLGLLGILMTLFSHNAFADVSSNALILIKFFWLMLFIGFCGILARQSWARLLIAGLYLSLSPLTYFNSEKDPLFSAVILLSIALLFSAFLFTKKANQYFASSNNGSINNGF